MANSVTRLWSIGQRVVCINGRFPQQILEWASNLPREDQTYTIHSIEIGRCLYTRRVTVGLFLHELPTLEDRLAFRADRFAPLLEKLNEACQRRVSALTSPVPQRLPVSVSAVQTRRAWVAPQLAPARAKKRASMRARLENAAIRKAVLKAAAQERRKAPFMLFGRGHEARITLSVSVAAILRGLDIPRVFISGYGANYFYPRRVFATATRSLKRKFGRSLIAAAHKVYRVHDE